MKQTTDIAGRGLSDEAEIIETFPHLELFNAASLVHSEQFFSCPPPRMPKMPSDSSDEAKTGAHLTALLSHIRHPLPLIIRTRAHEARSS
jgi:hypothetical protein